MQQKGRCLCLLLLWGESCFSASVAFGGSPSCPVPRCAFVVRRKALLILLLNQDCKVILSDCRPRAQREGEQTSMPVGSTCRTVAGRGDVFVFILGGGLVWACHRADGSTEQQYCWDAAGLIVCWFQALFCSLRLWNAFFFLKKTKNLSALKGYVLMLLCFCILCHCLKWLHLSF